MRNSLPHNIVCDTAAPSKPESKRSVTEHIVVFATGTFKMFLILSFVALAWLLLLINFGKYVYFADNELLIKLMAAPTLLWMFAKYNQYHDSKNPDQIVTSDFVKFMPVAVAYAGAMVIVLQGAVATYNVQSAQCSVNSEAADCQTMRQTETRLNKIKLRLTNIV